LYSDRNRSEGGERPSTMTWQQLQAD